VFLDHIRLALLQVDAAGEAARLATRPPKPAFVVGFLIGQEVAWLPDTLRILREEAPEVEISIVSQSSPELASALMRGKVDVAFMRREQPTTGLAFKLLIHEPLVVILPERHRLARCKSIRPLTRSVVTRPLRGDPPTIDLVLGSNESNASPVLARFLARGAELVERVRVPQR
jgi:LysR family hca operon transcriptional activator